MIIPLTSQRIYILIAGLSGVALVFAAALAILFRSILPAPSLGELRNFDPKAMDLATEFYDRQGRKIGELAEEVRYYLPLHAVPPHVLHAFLSAEDRDFFSHHGVSPLAILRALQKNLFSGRVVQGASTITQQVVRLYFLNNERSYARKLREAALAIEFERRFSKDEILEVYLNKIYLGNHSFGIEAASRNYFRKSARELNVGEAAMLAGLPKAPSQYAINRNYSAAKARQRAVLGEMYRNGYLQQRDYLKWLESPVQFHRQRVVGDESARYFIDEARKQVAKKFAGYPALAVKGLKVYTTLDSEMQNAAQVVASRVAALTAVGDGGGSSNNRRLANRMQGAALVVDVKSGGILAMQGGTDFASSQYNRAMLMKRSMGDLFLPIYSAVAIDYGYTLSSPVDMEPIYSSSQKDVRSIYPTIYDVVTQGDMDNGQVLFGALGLGTVAHYARRLGFKFGTFGLGMAAGHGAASLTEIAGAYAAFANGGYSVTPFVISRVTDRHGAVLYQQDLGIREAVFRSETASIMMQTLRDNVQFGEARVMGQSPTEVAGYIATSGDLKNGWAVGMQGQVLVLAWIGDDRERNRVAGNRKAAQRTLGKLWSTFAPVLPPTSPVVGDSSGGLSYFHVKVEKEDGSFEKRTLPFATGTRPPSSRF